VIQDATHSRKYLAAKWIQWRFLSTEKNNPVQSAWLGGMAAEAGMAKIAAADERRSAALTEAS